MLLTLAASMLFSLPAHATESDLCAKYMPCGTYQGKDDDPERAGVTTTIAIAAEGKDTLKFDYTLTNEAGEASTWPIRLKFGKNGSFVGTLKGDVYANGVCAHQVCTYGMRPWEVEGESVGNSGIMKFKDGKLEFLMIYGTPSKFGRSLTTLEKK